MTCRHLAITIGLLAALLPPAAALTPVGLVFEPEDFTTPKTAWKLNQRGDDIWCLWTEEEDVESKRSRGASLASPAVREDRATPEDGAPPLHTVIDKLEPGVYHVWVSGPGRPLAYSLDGENWWKGQGGEIDLGIQGCPDGTFELWVDDRYASPGNPGSGYYDYVRFIKLPDGVDKVRRHVPWSALEAEVKAGGKIVPATALAAEGFRNEGGQMAVTGPGTLTYTFDQPGRYWLGVRLNDDPRDQEELRLLLNGKLLGTAFADGQPQLALFELADPVDVKAGDKLQLATATAGTYRVVDLLLSGQPFQVPGPQIENVETWSAQPGTAEICWTTSVQAPTGVVEYQAASGAARTVTGPTSLGRNHRVILTDLNPTVDYTATITTSADGETLTAAPVQFRAAPPDPGPTKAFAVELTVPEPTGAPREMWPATVGLPFAQGQLADVDDLSLTGPGGAVPLQAKLFSRWPDGSVKWATVSFPATTGADARYTLRGGDGGAATGQTVTVDETDDAYRVRTDALAFDLGKQTPALFTNVGIDANGDGAIAADEVSAAEPIGANLKLELGDGTFLTCGPIDSFEVTENGPVRAIVRWAGPLVDPAGQRRWRYALAATLWRGRTQMALQVTVINDEQSPRFQRVNSLALRVPLTGQVAGALEGGEPAPVPDADGWWIQQDLDNHYTLRTAAGEKEGERATGVATAANDNRQVTVAIADFWETYPSGFAIKPDGIHVRLLPELPEHLYDDPALREKSLSLFTWYQEGDYVFKAGQVSQHEVYVDFSPPGRAPAAGAFAEWMDEPAVPQASAEYLIGTDVLGRKLFLPRKGVWDDYEAFFENGYLNTEKDRETRRAWGWMHWGDWFGERILNWGNNEYDLPWAMGVQWLRTLDRRYFDRGLQMARHYSTVDTAAGEFTEAWNGLVYEHSFNHIGTELSAEDPRFEYGDGAAYLKEFGTGMFRGAIDRQGHVFEAGNWLYAALTGDPWLRDVAERVSTNQAEKLTPRFDFTIERAGGWPLINMVNAYTFSGNPYYLNAARLMIERTLQRQDPSSGGFLHQAVASEVDGESVMGGKAFAVGILSHGILRYLDQEPEPRPDVEQMLVRTADWLADESWNPGKGFRYISRARKFANTGGRGATSLLNAEVVAYAYEKTKDPKYLSFFQEMMAGQLDQGAHGMGKSFTMDVRQTVYGLDRMVPFGLTDAPRPVAVMLRDKLPLTDGAARIQVIVENPADQPKQASVKVLAGAAPAEVRWTAPAQGRSLAPPLELKAEKPGPVDLEIAIEGAAATRKRVNLIDEPAPAAPVGGHGVAYVGPVESATRRALAASGLDLPAVTDPFNENLGQYAGLIIACDSWQSGTVNLPRAADKLTDFVRGGGKLAIWQLNDDSWNPGWLPYDLFLFDADSTLGAVTGGDHPLFAGLDPAKLKGAKMYDSLGPVAAPWQTLATDAEGRPAIVEAKIGNGRIVMIEPSLDRYAAANGDEPDNAVPTEVARTFVKNLAAYLAQ